MGKTGSKRERKRSANANGTKKGKEKERRKANPPPVEVIEHQYKVERIIVVFRPVGTGAIFDSSAMYYDADRITHSASLPSTTRQIIRAWATKVMQLQSKRTNDADAKLLTEDEVFEKYLFYGRPLGSGDTCEALNPLDLEQDICTSGIDLWDVASSPFDLEPSGPLSSELAAQFGAGQDSDLRFTYIWVYLKNYALDVDALARANEMSLETLRAKVQEATTSASFLDVVQKDELPVKQL